MRFSLNGNCQVVYDTLAGKRVLLNIKDPKDNLVGIDEALREGVVARNVLAGVMNALTRRDICFDYLN